MSSFTHYLEAQMLNGYVKIDGLYLGLSRIDGNRQGTFASWTSDGEGGYEVKEEDEGIDEPGEGWYEEDDGTWSTDDTLATSYSRQAVGAADWHPIEVVLGENGDSELRLANSISFGTLGEGEDWGTINTFFLADAATVGGGNILAWGSMPDSVQLVEGMEGKLWANTIVVRMTD